MNINSQLPDTTGILCTHQHNTIILTTSDCNPGIPAVPGIGSIQIMEFWDYKKFVKIVLFKLSDDKNKNSSHLTKYFMRTRVLAVHCICILTVTVTPYSSDIPTSRGILHCMHKISQVGLLQG